MVTRLIWAALALLIGAHGAGATPFGPATASLGSFDVPTVTLGSTNGTITLNGGSAQLSSGTGSFANAPYAGSGSGTLTFGNAVGTVIGNPLRALFSFSDNAGGAFVFDLQSVRTIAYSYSPGISTSIALYLLGTVADDHLGLTASPTSLTMTFNRTGSSSFSESGSVANPPAPVPEPGSIAVLGLGLIAIAAARRRFGRRAART